ncbi:MAG: hypothetical protein QM690_06020 [Sphingobium sp.]
MRDSSRLLAQVRHSLERLEPRRTTAAASLFASGHEGIDRALGGGFARGRLHEVFAGEEYAGSGAGLTALLALRAMKSDGAREMRPFLWLRTETVQKRAGGLHATGLGELGLDPAMLLLGLVPDEGALLHAAAEATRCAGLGALLVECWGPMRGLDLTASRRLMLAAEGSGVTLFLLRIGGEPVPSAADTRWQVTAAPSIALEANAPGAPMFEIQLLRRRAGPPAGPWRVEWDRDGSCFRKADGRDHAGSPLSRPVLPLVADGAPEPLRRAG